MVVSILAARKKKGNSRVGRAVAVHILYYFKRELHSIKTSLHLWQLCQRNHLCEKYITTKYSDHFSIEAVGIFILISVYVEC